MYARDMSNGTVYRRETPSGASSWVAHVAWYEAGKRRQMKRTFRTKKDAQTSLVELLAAHQTGRFVESSKLTVSSFADAWLDGLANQGRKATTLNGYRRIIDSYVAPRLGDVALQDVKASDLDSLYAELLRGGGANGRRLSLTSVHHVHAALN